MKKHTQIFKQMERDNRNLTYSISPWPLIKLIIIALAFGLICFLSIYFLSVPASAHRTDTYLKLEEQTNENMYPDRDDLIYYYDDESIRRYEETPFKISQRDLAELEEHLSEFYPDQADATSHFKKIISQLEIYYATAGQKIGQELAELIEVLAEYYSYPLNYERDQADKALDREQDDTGEGFFQITDQDYITEKEGGNTLIYPKTQLW